MLGFSIFLTEEIDHLKKQHILEMKRNGFQGVFTSIHIPEEDSSLYLERLKELGHLCKKLSLELMVDISGTSLEKLGLSFDNTDELLTMGVTGLRMDYAIPNEQIAKISRSMKVALNASTFTQKDYDELQRLKANFNQMEMWHNYYPRPNTGLDKIEFKEKNLWLQSLGFTIMAFVPGDSTLRGPLKKTLPTLEEHRFQNPLACTMDLIHHCSVTHVYIGDPEIKVDTLAQFSTWNLKNKVLLFVENLTGQFDNLVLKTHMNRHDAARDAFRSSTARVELGERTIYPNNCIDRKIGSVTLDNELYGRYMGEFQIVKRNLSADKRVNVVGNIVETDLPLLSQIKAGMKVNLRKKENLDGARKTNY